jgi:hypothetical protein
MQLRPLPFVVGVTAFAFALSCGGGGAKGPPQPATAPQAPGQEMAVGPLGPVSAPRDLFAVARLRSAAKLADVGVRWTSLPVDWRSLVAKNLPGLERVLAFDAPVDAAAVLDPSSLEPKVFWAFAFGVSSADAAATFFLEQGNSVVRKSPGVYVVRLDAMSCQIAAARGVAAARVVCADEMNSVDALSPYMTRGLPAESLGASEVHFHVSAEPFRRRYSSELRLIKTMGVPFVLRELELGHPKFDRALRDAVYGFAEELIALASDLDRIDFDASLTPREDAIDARMSVAMVGLRSWTAQGIVRASGGSGPPPDFFWQLPKDSTAASYGTYADPEHARGFVASLGELLDGWLDYNELPDARRRPLVDTFQEMFTIGAHSVYASLPSGAPSRPVPDANRKTEATRKLLGAHVFALDHGGERIQKFASELVKAFGNKPFRDRLVKSKLVRAEQLPVLRERAAKGKGLPAGSKTFEIEFAPEAFSTESSASFPTKESGRRKAPGAAPASKKAAAGPKTSVVFILVPDGPRTWGAFGTDEALLVGRLVEAKSGNGATLTLRDGLAALRGEKAVSAGFSSLAAALGSFDESVLGGDAPWTKTAVGRLPHRGETPMLWHLLFEPAGPKVVMSGNIPQTVVEDLVALTVSGAPKNR